jgi:thiol-disulfide isomerase/thioredoxin
MSTRVRVAVLVAFVAVAVVGVLVARHQPTGAVAAVVAAAAPPTGDLPTLGDAPPSATVDGTWLDGTRPVLSGKVVLYDFWTFGCINCQHTLAHVKAWAARYGGDGLVVVGVHSPEFDYERVPANVRDYVRTNDITYPVLLDPDMRVWTAFGVRAWPTFVLVDGAGRRRHVHVGEGGYDDTEDAIRRLLGVDPASPRAQV